MPASVIFYISCFLFPLEFRKIGWVLGFGKGGRLSNRLRMIEMEWIPILFVCWIIRNHIGCPFWSSARAASVQEVVVKGGKQQQQQPCHKGSGLRYTLSTERIVAKVKYASQPSHVNSSQAHPYTTQTHSNFQNEKKSKNQKIKKSSKQHEERKDVQSDKGPTFLPSPNKMGIYFFSSLPPLTPFPIRLASSFRLESPAWIYHL